MTLEQKEETHWKIYPSDIHEKGIFVVKDIPAETRIIEYIGEKITKAEANRRGLALLEHAKANGGGSVYIFQLNKKYDIDGNVPANHARHINHSCDPNCEARNVKGRIWIVALRDIEAGEELSYDYGYDLEHFLDHPCRCGSELCAGYIVGTDKRKKLKKILRNRKKRVKRKASKSLLNKI